MTINIDINFFPNTNINFIPNTNINFIPVIYATSVDGKSGS